MTDEQIIKALECCKVHQYMCENDCPLFIDDECGFVLPSEALDLINRQQAEIERLKKENERFADIGKLYSEIKADAYKEFAERVKQLPSVTNCEYEWTYLDIDNLRAELTPTSLNKLPHASLCETETYEGDLK